MHIAYRILVALLICLMLGCASSASAENAMSAYGDLPPQEQAEIADAITAAKDAMLAAWDESTAKSVGMGLLTSGKLMVLRTVVYVVDEDAPAGATEAEHSVFEKYYQDARYVVSFTALVDYYGYIPELLIMHPDFADYKVLRDGEVEAFNLQRLHAKLYANPVVPGMTAIDCGDIFNTTYYSPEGQ